MPKQYEIRADYDVRSITVYQAYSEAIAKPALSAQRFVAPFSLSRMTWIKPSFLWLMERSNWGQKSGQEFILAIKMTRSGWDEALSLGVLTSPEKTVYKNTMEWKHEFDNALVHIQWDPERSIRGAIQPYDSIQVGLSRSIIERYVKEWIMSITDYTPVVKKMRGFIKTGDIEKAKKLLPLEKVYPVVERTGRRLLIR